MTNADYWNNLINANETWTITFHEGSGQFNGKSFKSRMMLMAAMREIRDEWLSGCMIGYIKTYIKLEVDGKKLWEDRIDVDGDELSTPWEQWRYFRDHYASEEGKQRAKRFGADADTKVRYYTALVNNDYATANSIISATEAS